MRKILLLVVAIILLGSLALIGCNGTVTPTVTVTPTPTVTPTETVHSGTYTVTLVSYAGSDNKVLDALKDFFIGYTDANYQALMGKMPNAVVMNSMPYDMAQDLKASLEKIEGAVAEVVPEVQASEQPPAVEVPGAKYTVIYLGNGSQASSEVLIDLYPEKYPDMDSTSSLGDNPPTTIMTGLTWEAAQTLKTQLEATGAIMKIVME